MISERHKTNNLVTIFCCCLCLSIVAGNANEVFEVLPQKATTTAAKHQDGVNVLAFVTPNATTAPRIDPNNNNEWRPLGHGDPLQKDPTYDYSPPALERVRYWAENNVSSQETKHPLPVEHKTKKEILLLGVASEHSRPATAQQAKQPKQPKQTATAAAAAAHYASLALSQQQAKYAAIRRSYYAPPQQQQQQHMPHTHLMPPPMMMMKSMGHSMEYHHNVMNSPSSSSYMSMNMGGSYSSPSKPAASSTHYYSSPATASSGWYTHTPSLSSMSSMSSLSLPQRLSYADAHHQESMQHYSFSRPQTVSYAPNSIHALATGVKQATVPRKPWLHELLQKELVKPTLKQRMKPTMPATKYLMGTTKPQQLYSSATYAPLTYTPISFVSGPPTIATPTVNTQRPELYVTPTTLTPSKFQADGFRPMLLPSSSATTTRSSSSSTSSTTSSTTRSTTSTTTTALPVYQHTETSTQARLIIPPDNNLARRPTVAPATELTTDSLFSHYKQPPQPLLGPMYLIIEGHSKVKTYGQNELDPHSPKIVPVISKREPVVRIADPNEKRGTVETYQVKHLHTKTTPLSTTKSPKTTTTSSTSTTTTTPKTTTTTRTTTTAKPSTEQIPLISSSTSLPAASGVQDLLSLLDNMFADAHDIVSTTTAQPTASRSNSSSTAATPTSSTGSTILKPLSMKLKLKLKPEQPEPRIGSQAGSIVSLLQTSDEVKLSSELATSTESEQPPRATRQIFDYDQLPESRIKAATTADLDYEADDDDDDDDENDDDDDEEEEDEQENVGDDDVAGADGAPHVSEDETSDSEHNLLKRIDKFVDDVDDGDDDLDDLIEGLSPYDHDDNEHDDAERQQRQHHP